MVQFSVTTHPAWMIGTIRLDTGVPAARNRAMHVVLPILDVYHGANQGRRIFRRLIVAVEVEAEVRPAITEFSRWVAALSEVAAALLLTEVTQVSASCGLGVFVERRTLYKRGARFVREFVRIGGGSW